MTDKSNNSVTGVLRIEDSRSRLRLEKEYAFRVIPRVGEYICLEEYYFMDVTGVTHYLAGQPDRIEVTCHMSDDEIDKYKPGLIRSGFTCWDLP